MDAVAGHHLTNGPRRASGRQATLLHVPITDSTAPYHSLVYLASFARAAGFRDVAIRDTNIEALYYCARTDVATAMMDDWSARRRELGSRRALNGNEQLEYYQLVRAAAIDPAGLADSIATMREPDRFYRYAEYRRAAQRLGLWLEVLSCNAWPGQFEPGGHSLRRGGWLNLSSIADLTDDHLLDRLVGPFTPYYTDILFPELVAQAPAIVGVNITYTSQLPYALWLVRRVRRLLPDSFIVCGGTEVSGCWKYLRDKSRFMTLFAGADACVIGEGETAFVRLLDEVLNGRDSKPIPNVVRFDRRRGEQSFPPGLHYEVLDELPLPDFTLIDQSPYFSPHPIFNYSPTRGCYWNKCTFCDYGLNFGTPTSPWRQESLEKSVANLTEISRIARHIYLSVDVLAPGRLLRLAEAITESRIDLRWSAEIRLERFFNRERCDLLRKSGCVAVSVGFESASQRILDLIRKGVAIADVENTIRCFSESGVAVQMMGFTGFPSETAPEAMASVHFLEETSKHWTTSALGSFILTPGSILAERYRADQPQSLSAVPEADIDRTLTILDPARAPDATTAELSRAKARLSTAEWDRPFAGGIDAAHSIFYYAWYGRAFPRDVISDARREMVDVPGWMVIAPSGVVLASEAFGLPALPALRCVREMGRRAMEENRLLNHEAFVAGLAGCPPVVRTDRSAVVVRPDGVSLSCPEGLGRLLDWLGSGRRFDQACEFVERGMPADESEDLAAYARALRSADLSSAPSPGSEPILSWQPTDTLVALCGAELLKLTAGASKGRSASSPAGAEDMAG